MTNISIKLEDLYDKSPSARKVDDFIRSHNFEERLWILSMLPKKSKGAELGVFTGMFSEQIMEIVQPEQLWLVDIWTLQGENFGDWGGYTDFGRLKTADAKEAVQIRASSYTTGKTEIIEGSGIDWLNEQSDMSLDWVYVDTTHKYEQTMNELKAAAPKLKRDGILLGDDWVADINHDHAGVLLAVNDFVRSSDYDLQFAGRGNQWMLRRRQSR